MNLDELCRESCLTKDDVAHLEKTGLLRPTYSTGWDPAEVYYRPKLASWGKKLRFLLDEGWTLDEIKKWSKERWSWADPRVWPPPKPKI